eukprot:TRINITY_DN25291_c0_g1_i1.p1 TRINITY_DN25291_c0_g1~~TRINITY_DN25291_c0_g1_i1.p1  ORF type:complete len:173 (+),score=30.67 TRINITY_DN25291_c0_g1_i1:35-553(+)
MADAAQTAGEAMTVYRTAQIGTKGRIFRLRVRGAGGKSTDVEASTAETVGDLKQRMNASYGMPVDEQRLLCKGTVMVEHRSLGSYGLDDDSVIVCAPQLKMNCSKPFFVQPRRGFMMVPGSDHTWRPNTSGKTTADEADLFFDSNKAPSPWEIRTHEFTSSKAGTQKALPDY